MYDEMNTCLISEWLILRSEVEYSVGRNLSDEEWTEFTEEIRGRVDNYCNELYEDLVDQIGKGFFKPKSFDKFKDA